MAEHGVTVEWLRGEADFLDHRYSRAHLWRFDGGAVVPASSSPSVVRVPFSDPAGVDPEEGFVAALASCHMLWFLDLAARAGVRIDTYRDTAAGTLAKRDDGTVWLSTVALRPHVVVAPDTPLDQSRLDALHDKAHHACFLANSVTSKITIAATTEVAAGS